MTPYPMSLGTFANGYIEAINANKAKIINTIQEHSKRAITKEEQDRIVQEIIYASEWSVAKVQEDPPLKSDAEWKDALKKMKAATKALHSLDALHFSYLDATLMRDDNTYQLLRYYSNSCGRKGEETLTLSKVHEYLTKSIPLWVSLVEQSIKGRSVGRGSELDALKQYCFMLYRIFKRYTGKPMTINSPFERFVLSCLSPLRGKIPHGYTEESVRKSIRWLKEHRGAEIDKI